MKKVLSLIVALIGLVSVSHASNLVYSGVMVSTNGNASSTAAASTATYTMDVNNPPVAVGGLGDIISAQLDYSSSVIANVPFTDGSYSTFTLTVASTQGIVGAKATDTLTVTVDSALVASPSVASVSVASNTVNLTGGIIGSTITIALVGDVINSSYNFIGGRDYQVGASSNATAINLAAVFNSNINGLFAAVSPAGGSTVTITNDLVGANGNNFVITTSTSAALPVTAFQSGQSSASFTLNGVQFKVGQNLTVDVNTASNTAVNFAQAINLSGGYGVTAATTAATVVTLTANSTGTFANAFTLTSSTGALGVGSATFSGGLNSGVFCVNGVCLAAGTHYAIGSSSGTTALNIAAAINGTAGLNGIVVSSAAACPAKNCGIVYTTGTIDAPGYTITSSTQSAITIGPFTSSSPVTGFATGTMSNGSNASYVINTPTITVTGHNLQTGVAVYLSTGTGVNITPLAWGTTYYAIRIDANNFSLAGASTAAFAGTFISLTSSNTTTTQHSFTLNTVPLTGSAIFTLQGSDDGVNFASLSVAPVSFISPYTTGSSLWDLGTFNHRYLRLLYQGPTFGGTNFSLYVNQKESGTAR